jgi:catechol 2,3-dioxygenase-like lactoylglutathione lyase family enzyme
MKSIIATLLWAVVPQVFAQPATPSAPEVGGIIQFNQGAADLEKSERFYHGVLGLESSNGDPRMQLGWYEFGPRLIDMYATRGRVRNFALQIPNAGMLFEPLQWSEAKGKVLATRIQDPGASFLILDTWNIDAAMERLSQGRVEIITKGRKPVTLVGPDGQRVRTLWTRDPDGMFVQLVQTDPPSVTRGVNGAFPGSWYTGGHVGFVVENLDNTVRVYKELLGFDVQSSAFAADPQMLAAVGLERGEYRTATLRKPGSTVELRLVEFRGIERKLQQRQVIDSGSSIIRLRVQGIDAVVQRLQAAGIKVVSASGAPTQPPGARGIMMEGPDNIFLQLLEVPPPR